MGFGNYRCKTGGLAFGLFGLGGNCGNVKILVTEVGRVLDVNSLLSQRGQLGDLAAGC